MLTDRPIVRVLSIPGRFHDNRYLALMLGGLEKRGVKVVDPTPRGAASFGYDVLHLNFPTHYITENGLVKAWLISIIFGLYLIAARLLGCKIVYSVHDVVPFRTRHPFLLFRFLHLVHSLSSGFVFLSRSSREAFVRIYPTFAGKPWVLAAHGPYPTSIIPEQQRQSRRLQLAGETRSFLFGFLGNIKPYKNIRSLLQLPEVLPDGRPVRMLVAGQVERGHEADVAAVLQALPPGSLIRLDKRLSDAELDALIQIVDVVLVPYVKGSNSGVALLVLSNHARLIGSGLPIFDELSKVVGAPWVYSYATDGDAGRTLGAVAAEAARDGVTHADRDRLQAYLDQVSYDQGATAVALFYRRLLESNDSR